MKEPSTLQCLQLPSAPFLQFTLLWSCGLADEVPGQALTYCHVLHRFRPRTCPLAHRDILCFEEKPSQNGCNFFLKAGCSTLCSTSFQCSTFSVHFHSHYHFCFQNVFTSVLTFEHCYTLTNALMSDLDSDLGKSYFNMPILTERHGRDRE